ncbi:MAG: hydrogenase 3 maturation endopeptidase HyCI [Thermoproteota archaeon]
MKSFIILLLAKAPSMMDVQCLSSWLFRSRRIVIVGIGNPLRMDDSVGVRITRELHGKVPKNVFLVECETVPENFIKLIVDLDPSHILLIDAAIMGKKPGSYVFTKPERLVGSPTISTHALPLSIFCNFLSKMTKAKIALLLIEPESSDFGTDLTPAVDIASREIVSILLKSLSSIDEKGNGAFEG